MHYYEAVPLIATAKSIGVLTYSSQKKLNTGDMVRVPFGKHKTNAVIIRAVKKPGSFKVKPVESELNSSLPQELMTLAAWFSKYYAVSLPDTFRTLVPSGIHKKRQAATQDSVFSTDKPLVSKLNSEQAKVANEIERSSSQKFLLQGVTGSGKTHIYIHLINNALANGKSCIVLLPEIALSSHIMERLQGYIAKPVVHLHSSMSERERHLTWKKLRESAEPLVVVGPRSAVFAPVHNLGLIVIDESHDQSYKQDQTPHYDAIFVASKRCEIENSKLLLGTATPKIVTRFLSEQSNLKLLELKNTHFKKSHSIKIVDSSRRSNFSKNPFISDLLLAALEKTFTKKRQSLLFVNRRGYAPAIKCQSCHWRFECMSCLVPLTYHSSVHMALCHICGRKFSLPSSCPECSQPTVRLRGAGTQKLEASIKQLLPHAHIVRVDKDTKSFDHHANSLSAADIIIGTQMITKGFDLPRLETVGVVNADSFLLLPDFSASEKTYQTLTQVIGRNDRRGLGGTTIIQTSLPKHYAIESAVNNDYEAFYRNESKLRQAAGYPPYRYLLKILARRKTESGVKSALSNVIEVARSEGLSILGPTPSFHEHAHGYISWHILIKSNQRSKLVDFAGKINKLNIVYELDPENLL